MCSKAMKAQSVDLAFSPVAKCENESCKTSSVGENQFAFALSLLGLVKKMWQPRA